jgi:hypothetical protein
VCAVSERDGNRISDEGQNALRFVRPQFDANASVENEHHPILADELSVEERDAPTMNHDVVMDKRTRKRKSRFAGEILGGLQGSYGSGLVDCLLLT